MKRPFNPDAQKLVKELLREAVRYAGRELKKRGQIPPTLFAETANGRVKFVPKAINTAAEKDRFANTGRILAIATNATALVMVLESWAVFAKTLGDPLPEVPSKSPDREEVVMISVETRGEYLHQILAIQRDAKGTFAGFSPIGIPEADIKGRFAQLLPPKAPGEGEMRMARMLLPGLGVLVEGGQNPDWN